MQDEVPHAFEKHEAEGKQAATIIQGLYYKIGHVSSAAGGTGIYRQEPQAGAVNSKEIFAYKVARQIE